MIEILMKPPALPSQIGLSSAAHRINRLSGSEHMLHPSFVVSWFGPSRSCLRFALRLSRLIVSRGDPGRLLELILLILAQMLVGLLRWWLLSALVGWGRHLWVVLCWSADRCYEASYRLFAAMFVILDRWDTQDVRETIDTMVHEAELGIFYIRRWSVLMNIVLDNATMTHARALWSNKEQRTTPCHIENRSRLYTYLSNTGNCAQTRSESFNDCYVLSSRKNHSTRMSKAISER